MEKPLTVNEAAEFLSVNPFIIRKYIHKGMLKAHRIGDGTGKTGQDLKGVRFRIWKKDLIAFLEGGEINHDTSD